MSVAVTPALIPSDGDAEGYARLCPSRGGYTVVRRKGSREERRAGPAEAGAALCRILVDAFAHLIRIGALIAGIYS